MGGAPVARSGARPTAPSAPRSVAPAEADSATAKVLALVAGLVRDSVVQRRIQADPELRAAWQDPNVRRIVTRAP